MTAPQPTARDSRPDEQLLSAADTGDRDAWQALVDRYADTVWELAERLVGTDLAVGVSEVVWLRLATALPMSETAGRLSLWLHRAVWDACTQLTAGSARELAGP